LKKRGEGFSGDAYETEGSCVFVVTLLAMTGFAQAEQGKLSVGLSLPYSL
jgi:hypothetical protein